MKTFPALLTAVLFLLACGNPEHRSVSGLTSSKFKRYDLRSGIIRYRIQISGKPVVGTVKGSGTEKRYFRDWGNTELRETQSQITTTVNVLGHQQTQTEKTREISKLDGGRSYTVDFAGKKIYVNKDPALQTLAASGSKDAGKAGRKMLESMGGKMTGKENYKGYECEVWEIPGGRQWIYRGVPLRVEMTVMGVRTVQEATDIQFDIPVPDKYFQLPDFPVTEISNGTAAGATDSDRDERQKAARQMNRMSFEQFKENLRDEAPEQFRNMSEEDLRRAYRMMKAAASDLSQ